MSKRLIIPVFLACIATTLAAGDMASFVNLGFSGDGSRFMFGQHGISAADGSAYASIDAVDVARNVFIPDGRLESMTPSDADNSQDSAGALLNLLHKAGKLVKACGIDHLRKGRLLYILLDGEAPKTELSFRDFRTGAEYNVTLSQNVVNYDHSVSSSFSLLVKGKAADGSAISIQAGNPDIRRQGVESYLIRQIILSPDSRHLVVVIEKGMREKGGSSLRYMVETLSLR